MPTESCVIVGAGRVAARLAPMLNNAGVRVLQLYNRHLAAAQHIASPLQAEATDNLAAIRDDADLYVVAVTDDAVPAMAVEVSSRGGRDALFVHTAGSVSIDVWQNRAMHYGVLYPLQSITHERRNAPVPFLIEANDEVAEMRLRSFARLLSDTVYTTTSDERKIVHVAAVLSCNFTNHFYTLAAELLHDIHIPFDILLPLIDETVARLHEIAPQDAQTGPAARGNATIIAEHLRLLADKPALRAIYQHLTDSIYEHYQL
jgi:predicted short-subunit dehydrogenase-like oxidoreductase (DUF2520 family)